jgi:hypothetical protein
MDNTQQPGQTVTNKPYTTQPATSTQFSIHTETKKKYKGLKIVTVILLIFLIVLSLLIIYVRYTKSQVHKSSVSTGATLRRPKKTKKNYNIYTDKTNHFSIHYPLSWYHIVPESGVVGFSTYSGPYKGTIIVFIFDSEDSNQDLQDITKPVNGIKMNNQITKGTVNGTSLIKLLSTSQGNSSNLTAQAYYYILIAVSPSKTLRITTNPKDKPILDLMLPTFMMIK